MGEFDFLHGIGRKRQPQELVWEQVAGVLDPTGTGLYAKYADDYVGFIENELGQYLPQMLKDVVQSVYENEWTLVPSATGVGKSWLAAMLAVTMYKVHRDVQVYCMAAPPKANLMSNILAKIATVVRANPVMFANDRMNMMQVYRSSEQKIEGLIIPQSASDEEKETRFSGRHSPVMLVVLDESDAIDPAIWSAVEGWGSGGHIFRVLALFNPKIRSGAAWEAYDKGTAKVVRLSAFDHPNVVHGPKEDGTDIIPGAVNRATLVRRIAEQCVFEPHGVTPERDEDAFYLPEFLVGEVPVTRSGKLLEPLQWGIYKPRVDHPDFSYKVRGLYPSEGEGVTIPEELISNARSRWDAFVAMNMEHGKDMLTPPEGTMARMGFDVADEGNDFNVIAIRHGMFLQKFHTRSRIDPNAAANWGAEIYHEVKPSLCVIDSNGLGAGVPGKMSELKCRKVVGVMFQEKSYIRVKEGMFHKKRDELYWLIRVWLEGGGMLPNDSELLDELRVLRHTENNSGTIQIIDKKRIKSILQRSPDKLDALALSLSEGKTSLG